MIRRLLSAWHWRRMQKYFRRQRENARASHARIREINERQQALVHAALRHTRGENHA